MAYYEDKFEELNSKRMYTEAYAVVQAMINLLVSNNWLSPPNGDDTKRLNELKATMDHISRKLKINTDGSIDLEENMYTESEMEKETSDYLKDTVIRKKSKYIELLYKAIESDLAKSIKLIK